MRGWPAIKIDEPRYFLKLFEESLHQDDTAKTQCHLIQGQSCVSPRHAQVKQYDDPAYSSNYHVLL